MEEEPGGLTQELRELKALLVGPQIRKKRQKATWGYNKDSSERIEGLLFSSIVLKRESKHTANCSFHPPKRLLIGLVLCMSQSMSSHHQTISDG